MITAAGSGCVAALSVERYLVSKDLLVEFHRVNLSLPVIEFAPSFYVHNV